MGWSERSLPLQRPRIRNRHGHGDQLGGQFDSWLDFPDYDGQNDAEWGVWVLCLPVLCGLDFRDFLVSGPERVYTGGGGRDLESKLWD